MTTYLDARRSELSFGDVCDAEFLYDVHVREDARAMTREEAPATFAKKKWDIDQPVPYFVPSLDLKRDESYALAHGWHRRAICMSDDCLILSVFGRDREPDGRLLFAPVVDATDEAMNDLNEAPTYGRFPLPGDEVHGQHAIVELRRCFMADARDVYAALPAFVVLSTADTTRQGLANRWAAYSCRRGPFVAEDNVEKFAQLLVDTGLGEDEAVDLAQGLANVAGAAWAYEGRGLEAAGVAGDEKTAPEPVLAELERQLGTLADLVPVALAAVRTAASKL